MDNDRKHTHCFSTMPARQLTVCICVAFFLNLAGCLTDSSSESDTPASISSSSISSISVSSSSSQPKDDSTKSLLTIDGISLLVDSSFFMDKFHSSSIKIAFKDEETNELNYIEINGFRGWVQEIGVRTTTLVNNDGNLKHFSNQNVKNILNLSRRNCQYTINVTIASDQSLTEVEEILKRELPKIGKNTPEIIKGPEYKGVKGFNAGSVTLENSAECKEHNYGKVRSQLNRSVRLILEENGIAIK